MRLSTQYKKLHEKMKKERNKDDNTFIFPSEEIKLNIKREHEKKTEHNIIDILRDLHFFKKLLKIIEEGGTGFDLAYEIEKNHAIKKLIYKGILFYNNFIEIGDQKFIDIPNTIKTDYKHFKTIEKTEKYIFLIWLQEVIKNIEELLKSQNIDINNLEDLFKKLNIKLTCQKCNSIVKDFDQTICENCGAQIRGKK